MFRRRRSRRDARAHHPRVLVVHVQRTGGTSLRRMIEETEGTEVVFPSTAYVREHNAGRYVPPQELLSSWQTLPTHRFLFAHCLASLSETLPRPYARATFVREPLARSISIVQLHARTTERTVSELVEDSQFLDSHIADLQTRVFGFGADFATLRPQETPPATDEVLEQAMMRMHDFEFVGTTATLHTSLRRFDATFGTRLSKSVLHLNGSHAGNVVREELVERFTPLVRRDVELYEAARQHVSAT